MRGVALSIAVAANVILAVGCGGEQTAGAGEPPEVAAVRLFIKDSEVTSHVPLNRGQLERLEVRLYAANGSRKFTSFPYCSVKESACFSR